MWRNHPKISLCVDALRRGEVVAYPTEAVWGLGCDPFNVHAVEHILELKKRHWSKGLILVAGNIHQLGFLLEDLPAQDIAKLEKSWPGHITWLVRHCGRIPSIVSGKHKTVGLRVSAHPVVQALCEKFSGPIVSTSANPQGLQPARTAFAVRQYFRGQVTFSPGVVGVHARPSKIVDLASGAVIR